MAQVSSNGASMLGGFYSSSLSSSGDLDLKCKQYVTANIAAQKKKSLK